MMYTDATITCCLEHLHLEHLENLEHLEQNMLWLQICESVHLSHL